MPTSATHGSARCLSEEPDPVVRQRGAAARREYPQREGAQEVQAMVEEPRPQWAPQVQKAISGKCTQQEMPASNPRIQEVTRGFWRGKAVSELILRRTLKRSVIAAKQPLWINTFQLEAKGSSSHPRKWRRTRWRQRQELRPLKQPSKELLKTHRLSLKPQLSISRIAKQKLCTLTQSKPCTPAAFFLVPRVSDSINTRFLCDVTLKCNYFAAVTAELSQCMTFWKIQTNS